MIITNASKKTNQADTDQCTQAAIVELLQAEERTAEPTKSIYKICEIVYLLKYIYLILKLLVRNQYKL